MADNVSVPFLDSKISIQDLKNLEKAGSLITIFRELKKIEKIAVRMVFIITVYSLVSLAGVLLTTD